MRLLDKRVFPLMLACCILFFSFSSVADAPVDVATLEKSSKNACDFVAQAYSHENENHILSRQGVFVSSDGKKIPVRLGWGGSCGGEQVEAEKKEDAPSVSGFYVPSSSSDCSPDMAIVSFRGKDYILLIEDDIPRSLTDPSKGPICSFGTQDMPYLVENKAPDLCKVITTSSYPDNIKWTYVKDIKDRSADNEARGPGGFATYYQTTTVTLGNENVRFGHFSWTPTAHACSYSGIRVWDEDGEKDKHKIINKSIEEPLGRCLDADADLKKINGDIYIEATGGEGYHHTLLKYEDGKFDVICKTNSGTIVTYSPIEPTTK